MACRFLGEIKAMWRSPCAGRLTQVIRMLLTPEHGASCRDMRPWMLMKCKPGSPFVRCASYIFIPLYNYMITVIMHLYALIQKLWFFKSFQLSLSLLPPCGCPRWKELQAWWNAGVRRGNSFKIRSKAESFPGVKFKIYQHGTLQIASSTEKKYITLKAKQDCSCCVLLPCCKVGTSFCFAVPPWNI